MNYAKINKIFYITAHKKVFFLYYLVNELYFAVKQNN